MELHNFYLPISLVLLCIIQSSYAASRECSGSELTAVMTECNTETNLKYRFYVPKVDCTVPSSHSGSYDIACDKTCEPGHYMDLNDRECRPCAAGNYSLGSGARVDYWPEDSNSLPLGFAIDDTYRRDFFSEVYGSCNSSTWTPVGDYLVSNTDDCYIRLMYVANLKIPGYVEFTYQYTDPALHFHFYVVDENCHESTDSSVYPKLTSKGEWSRVKVKLSPGNNKLYWRAYSVVYGAANSTVKPVKPLLLRSVYVNGVAYSTECNKCGLGFYQNQPGQSTCKPCDVNTYSNYEGSQSCKSCDVKSQYSLYAASKCEERPKCGVEDYYKYHAPCNDKGLTKETYEWIEPKICRGDLEGAVQLPASDTFKNCPACNPGMFKNEKGECEFCAPDQFSDGTKPCEKCPAKHEAVLMYDFEYWDSLPPNTDAYCYSTSEQGCPPQGSGWTLSNDAISSNLGNADDTIAILDIFVAGFTHQHRYMNGQINPVGFVEFVFEMTCDPEEPKCATVFAEATEVDFEVINYWEGTHGKTVYRYPVAINSTKTFTWAFQKSSAPEQENPSHKYRKAQLKIHSITINGTMEGGARECKPCLGRGQHCQECNPGYYYSKLEEFCVACPADKQMSELLGGEEEAVNLKRLDPVLYEQIRSEHTKDFIVNPLAEDDDNKCIRCGPGLSSNDGQRCHSDCKVFLEDGREVDLGHLNTATVSVRTQPVFSDSGFESYKLYNFSLCGNPDTGLGLATCYTNMSRIALSTESNKTEASPSAAANSTAASGVTTTTVSPDTEKEAEIQRVIEQSTKTGFVCRSDLFPSFGDIKDYFTERPTVLGEELIAVTSNRTYMNWTVKTVKENNLTFDINFYYISFQPTYACPNGRSVIVTLRCDPGASESDDRAVLIDASSPEATVDGCAYNFLRVSKHACPKCDPTKDYDEILGECHFGTQQIRYAWKNDKKICRDGDLPAATTKGCTFLTNEMQISVAVALLVVLCLAAVTSYYWRKTQRLEYKYQKLVQSSSKDGTTQFAEAPSCGLSEDEEDEDEVNMYNDRQNILGKLKIGKVGQQAGKMTFKNGSDEEAHVKLTTGNGYKDEDLDQVASRI